MSSVNKESFLSSFSICTPFTTFPCLTVLARTSSTMLKRSGNGGHPGLVPDLSRKTSCLSPLSMMLHIDFFVDSFYPVEKVPSIASSLRIFIMNACRILSNAFLNLLILSRDFLLELVYMMNYINWLSSVEPASHIWNKPHLVMVYNSFMLFWIWFANICWAFLYLCLWEILVFSFPFL